VTRTTGRAQTVEWNIPDELFPVCFFKIVPHPARYSSVLDGRSDIVRPGLWISAELSKFNPSMRNVMNDARCYAVQANKTETAEDLLNRKKLS